MMDHQLREPKVLNLTFLDRLTYKPLAFYFLAIYHANTVNLLLTFPIALNAILDKSHLICYELSPLRNPTI